MLERRSGYEPSAGRSLNEPLLEEVGLDDLLNGIASLAQRRCDGFDSDRSSAIRLGDQGKIAPIEGVESSPVDFEAGQHGVGEDRIHSLLLLDGGKVPQPLEQSAGDARRSS